MHNLYFLQKTINDVLQFKLLVIIRYIFQIFIQKRGGNLDILNKNLYQKLILSSSCCLPLALTVLSLSY